VCDSEVVTLIGVVLCAVLVVFLTILDEKPALLGEHSRHARKNETVVII
jgi:hypothetical protein